MPFILVVVQRLHYNLVMTTVKRLSRAKICIYAGDHSPPHFHILANDGREALVAIVTMHLLEGSLERSTKAEALEWAQNNRDLLYDEWMRLNNE